MPPVDGPRTRTTLTASPAAPAPDVGARRGRARARTRDHARARLRRRGEQQGRHLRGHRSPGQRPEQRTESGREQPHRPPVPIRTPRPDPPPGGARRAGRHPATVIPSALPAPSAAPVQPCGASRHQHDVGDDDEQPPGARRDGGGAAAVTGVERAGRERQHGVARQPGREGHDGAAQLLDARTRARRQQQPGQRIGDGDQRPGPGEPAQQHQPQAAPGRGGVAVLVAARSPGVDSSGKALIAIGTASTAHGSRNTAVPRVNTTTAPRSPAASRRATATRDLLRGDRDHPGERRADGPVGPTPGGKCQRSRR